MKKFEALTLHEAYEKASRELGCSLLELQSEVIQYPSKGVLGFGKKNAIIVAHFNTKDNNTKTKNITPEPEEPNEEQIVKHSRVEHVECINENFYETCTKEEVEIKVVSQNNGVENKELAQLIENQLKELFSHSCFLIDVVEVDVVDKTALIFIDGEDAALLIGKDGYRYNALSYMIFNWLFSKYDLFIKLEIARFLTSQQEMIRYTLRPTIEAIYRDGKGKTRPFDGILAQIALEQLREEFPSKYVAIKTSKEGERFVVVNDFLPKN